jgi:hypothetical protein
LIDIDDGLDDALKREACRRGTTEGAIVELALRQYLLGEEPAEITDPDEVQAVLQSAAGLWKDRTDIDLATLRRAGDERLERLFGDD